MSRATHRNNTFQAKPPFTNRVREKERFLNALETRQGPDDYRVLTFYGAGGHGKTSLNEEFQRILKEKKIVFASLNFDKKSEQTQRRPDTALKAIRVQLGQQMGPPGFFSLSFEEADAQFPFFDIAFRRYHELSRTGIPFEEAHGELVNRSWILNATLGIFDPTTFGIAPILMERLGPKIRQFCNYVRRHRQLLLEDLETLSATKLRDRLFACLGADLFRIMWGEKAEIPNDASPKRRVVILIDTYEALRENQIAKQGDAARRIDDWVRMLVDETPGVLYVITGRDELCWHKVDKDYGSIVAEHPLGGLSKADGRKALIDAGVAEEDIRERILKGAEIRPDEVLPFYLEVQTNLCARMRANRNLNIERFGSSEADVLARFLEYLDADERLVLRVLAHARFFDKALFKRLRDKFFPGATVTFQEVLERSLLRKSVQEDGEEFFAMHDLLRHYLTNVATHEDPPLVTSINTELRDWYDEQAASAIAGESGRKQERMLEEAAHHAGALGDEVYVEWCLRILPNWNRREFFEMTAPLLERALGILEQPDQPETGEGPAECGLSVAASPTAESADLLAKRAALHQMAGDATAMDENGEEAEKHFKQSVSLYQRLTPTEDSNSVAEQLTPALQRLQEAPEPKDPRLGAAVQRGLNAVWAIKRVNEAKLALAEFYEARGTGADYNTATAIFDQVLTEARTLRLFEPRFLARTNESFGSFLTTRGRALEAEPLLFTAWMIYRIIEGGESYAAVAAHEFAKCLLNQGRLNEALRYIDWATSHYAAGEGRPLDKAVLELLRSEILAMLDRADESLVGVERSARVFEENLAPGDYWLGLGELAHARILLQLGRQTDAAEHGAKALAILRRIHGDSHVNVGVGLKVLAHAHAAAGRYEEAKQGYLHALRVLEKTAGYDHHTTYQCLGALTKLLDQMADEDAAHYRRHREQAAHCLCMDLDLNFPETWEAEDGGGIIDRCRAHGSFPDDPNEVKVTLTRLPFLRTHAVAKFHFKKATPPLSKYAIIHLQDPDEVHVIDWTSRPCQTLIASQKSLAFNEESAQQYAQLFFECLRTNSGRFRIVDDVSALPWQPQENIETLEKQRMETTLLVKPQRVLHSSRLRQMMTASAARCNELLNDLASHNPRQSSPAQPQAKGTNGSTANGSGAESARTIEELKKVLPCENERSSESGHLIRAGECILVEGEKAGSVIVEGDGASTRVLLHSARGEFQILERNEGELYNYWRAYIDSQREDIFVILASVAFAENLYRCITGVFPSGSMVMYWDETVATGLCAGTRKVKPALAEEPDSESV